MLYESLRCCPDLWEAGGRPVAARSCPEPLPPTSPDDSSSRQTRRQFSQPRQFSRRSRVQEKLRQILPHRAAATKEIFNGSFSRNDS